MDEQQVSAWISDARPGPFLTHAGGDQHVAVELYKWHARQRGKELTRARVVAGVSLGFWAGLFENSNRYEELWRQRLRKAFPHGAVMKKDMTQPLRLIQRFRNRLAHHDCLLGQAVDERLADMLRIAGYVDPEAATWMAGQSEVPAALGAKPKVAPSP